MIPTQETLGVITASILLLSLLFVISPFGNRPVKTGSGISYGKYGCISKDPALHAWKQHMGLSACR